jgi:MFS family permease
MPEAYRALLRVPGAPALILSGLVGRLPIGMTSLAMLLLIREATGSFASAGAVAACYAVGGGLAAPIQGRLVDRFGQRTVLLPSALVNVSAIAGFVAVADSSVPDWVLLGLAAIAGASIPPLSACMRALWSSLLGQGPRLDTAYAVEAVMTEIFFIGGPLLTAAIIVLASPSAALLTAATFTLAGTIGFAATAASRTWRGAERSVGHAGALASAGMRTLVITVLPAGVVFGVLEVTLPAFADAHGSAASGGVLIAALGVGSMVGGLWYGTRRWTGPLVPRYIVLTLLFAAGLAPTMLAGTIPVMAVLVAVAGLTLAPLTTCSYGLIDRVAPAGTATEAYTWVITATVAGTALGAALAGTVVEGAGVGWALAGATFSAALSSAVVVVRRHTLSGPATADAATTSAVAGPIAPAGEAPAPATAAPAGTPTAHRQRPRGARPASLTALRAPVTGARSSRRWVPDRYGS